MVILALALNFEPNRLGIIGLLLLRAHPIRQLLVFLCTSFLVSAIAGLTVLFFLDQGSILSGQSSSAIMQIAVGTVALAVAAVLFTGIPLTRARPGRSQPLPADSSEAVEMTGLHLVDTVAKKFGGLARGSSPWFAVVLGLGISLPSVDYIALLLLIAASGEPREVQVAALFTFLGVANAVLMVPIISYVVAKDPTIRVLESLRAWVLARSRREYAVLLTVAGALMLIVGVRRL